MFTDLGIAFENCICLEISVINKDIVNPISFKIAVVSVLTLGFIRILSMPVLSILSKEISTSSLVVAVPYELIVSEAFNAVFGCSYVPFLLSVLDVGVSSVVAVGKAMANGIRRSFII